jgi:uncharacterized protein (DUF2336 family)
MILHQLIQWLRTASAGDRADTASSLARTYLYSDSSPEDKASAEAALLMLLDDPSPLVRKGIAEVFAASQAAPPAIVRALADDQPEIAAPILEHSPLLVDGDLVDQVATGSARVQVAIAKRECLPRAVSAALAEIGVAEACLVLLENSNADIAPFSLDRIIERHGHLAVIREALFARDELPAATHQALLAKLSATLADFVTEREWLADDRARRVTREACERATVTLASQAAQIEVRPLVRHLCESGQLNAGLLLRALLCGDVRLFEETLAQLSGLSLERVSAIIHDRGGGFRALYEKARLPNSLYPAFREVIDAVRTSGFVSDASGAARLKRSLVERVLTRCADSQAAEIDPLMTLLRRLATEAAREEARLFCDGVTAEIPSGQRAA